MSPEFKKTLTDEKMNPVILKRKKERN